MSFFSETYVLVRGHIINLRGTGQVLLFVPLLGFVPVVLAINKILWVMALSKSTLIWQEDAGDQGKLLVSIGIWLCNSIIEQDIMKYTGAPMLLQPQLMNIFLLSSFPLQHIWWQHENKDVAQSLLSLISSHIS